uniref:Scavenger receptor class B member 1 n=1 Tax=Clastoptera arizonana TaxID=38151 RepID=A0A1B6DV03_9HEMI
MFSLIYLIYFCHKVEEIVYRVLFACHKTHKKILHQENLRLRGTFLTLVCGLFAVTLGSVLLVLNPFDILFKMKVRFSEGSETFELWRQPPVQLNLKVYLFNVTNKDDFLSGKDDKLKFEQVGPYVYSEHMSHANVSFNSNNTMSSIPLHPLTYVPELSNGSEDDLVIMPNIAMLSIAHVVRDNFWTRSMLNMFIKTHDAQFLVEMTAKEFMFGYRSTILF